MLTTCPHTPPCPPHPKFTSPTTQFQGTSPPHSHPQLKEGNSKPPPPPPTPSHSLPIPNYATGSRPMDTATYNRTAQHSPRTLPCTPISIFVLYDDAPNMHVHAPIQAIYTNTATSFTGGDINLCIEEMSILVGRPQAKVKHNKLKQT